MCEPEFETEPPESAAKTIVPLLGEKLAVAVIVRLFDRGCRVMEADDVFPEMNL